MKEKCTVEDGLHVRPCEILAKSTEYGNPQPRKRGVFAWVYYSRGTANPTRTFFGVVTTEHPKGIVFNFCPFCGEKIDTPVLTDEQKEKKT